MAGAAEGGQFCLELRHFRAVDELAMRKHPPDRIVDRFAEPPALRGDIDEGHRFGTKMLVHRRLQWLEFRHRAASVSRRRGAAPCVPTRRALPGFPGIGLRFPGWPR